MEDPVAAMAQQPDNEKVELNDLGKLFLKFANYGGNASQNLMEGISDMSIYNWIRLIMVVGGYMLLRPYVIKIMSGKAVDKMERDDALEKAKAAISPNDIRGGVKKPAAEDDEDLHEGEGTGVDWGQKARTRQRQFLKNMMEAEEKRQQEEEDDKDIAEFLED